MASRAGAVWQRRAVLGMLIKRDLKSKYESSLLGYAWSLLEPLLLTGLYWFVFTQILDIQRFPDYGLFLVAGILPWLWFNTAVSDSTKVLAKQSKLITTMNLPRETFALEAVGSKFVEFLASLLVLPVFAIIAWRMAHGTFPAMLIAVALQTVLLTGITLFLSSVTVLLRDVQRVIRVVLRAMFYLSPVLYPATFAEERLGSWYRIYELNPLATILQLHRSVWFPERSLPGVDQLVTTSLLCLAVLALGWWTFRRLEPAVLKEL